MFMLQFLPTSYNIPTNTISCQDLLSKFKLGTLQIRQLIITNKNNLVYIPYKLCYQVY